MRKSFYIATGKPSRLDTKNGDLTGCYYVEKADGTLVEVVDANGKILESAGIEISDGDTFLDNNGNEALEWGVVAAAVNHLKITNAATGNAPILEAIGTDTNINLQLSAKGTGGILLENTENILDANGNELINFTATGSAVNEIGITNAATGNNPIISCEGEADIGITLANSEGEEIVIFDSIADSVNELTISSAATGNSPTIAATGDDANVSIGLTPKGTGNVLVNGGRGIVSNVANGYVPVYKALVKDNITAGTGGAIAITNYYTTVNTDGDDDAFTLADGDIIGQVKRIQLIADGGGNAVITPANFVDGTTITMADAGDYTILIWNGTGWTTLEDGNTVDGVSAPVIA